MGRNAAPLAGDEFSGPGAITPTRMDNVNPRDHAAKRKQTLLSLLDALNELTKEGGIDGLEKPNFEDDHDVPTVDEHHQKVGADAFNRFQRRVTSLDTELRNFSNAARQLGSSVGILSSAYHLRERLAHLLHLFRENAADLFPRKIARQSREPVPVTPALLTKKLRRPPPHVARPPNRFDAEDLDPEAFPNELAQLAKEVMSLLNCLNEFPEFSDEAVNASIRSFEADLKYWSSSLKAYEGQFKYPAVQRYLHDLTAEMGDHLDSITSSLAYFSEVGVPTIRFGQKHGAAHLQNLSTVATFFSAVTATTMQFSFEMTDGPIQNAVNSFWFASLVFSIASAVNSLLGLTWKQAMYRSPRHRVPWWVLIWIKRSPLVFLVVSVACFSVGLVLFTYASGQSHVTSTLTTVFTSFSSFGLVAVSVWFASERWAFARHRGQKWLADVLDDFNHRIGNSRPLTYCRKTTRTIVERGHARMTRSNTIILQASTRARTSLSDAFRPGRASGTSTGGSADSLPTVAPGAGEALASPPLSDGGLSRFSDDRSGAGDLEKANGPSILVNGAPVPESPTTSPARGRFASLVRSAVVMLRARDGLSQGRLRAPTRRRTMSATALAPDGTRVADQGPLGGLKASRLAKLAPRLKSLETTQDLAAHQALVKHLQFSPDGKFLATSSWDRTSVIFRVGEPFQQWRILAHPQGFVGQVAWSPSGKLLMTKLNRGMKVWTQHGVCQKTIDRGRSVQSITWLSDDKSFLSVEGSDVVKLDLSGKITGTYSFPRMKLHDVGATPDGRRLLAVGTLLESNDGLQPSKSRAEKRIIVYDTDQNEIESQVPVLNEVRDITMARNGKVALVSYENKAPPQLWKIDMLKDKEDPNDTTSRLTLRHTYMPKTLVDFAGPSYFGGKDDELVLCAGKAGDVHIWHRESGALLHHVKAQALGGDLTCIAWNHAAEDPFMFATGSHDGGVRIWTTPTHGPSIDVRDVSGAPTPSLSPAASPARSPALSPIQTPGGTTPRRPPSPLPLPPPVNIAAAAALSLDGIRTDSPVTQDVFESQDGHEVEGSGDSNHPLPRTARIVSFSTPPAREGS